MATLYVTSKVSLQCRVDEMSSPVAHPTRERRQRHDQWDCKTTTITECEWNWRFETAKTVLCSGTLPDGGTYYDDVIGGLWECGTKVTTNDGKFNER